MGRRWLAPKREQDSVQCTYGSLPHNVSTLHSCNALSQCLTAQPITVEQYSTHSPTPLLVDLLLHLQLLPGQTIRSLGQ